MFWSAVSTSVSAEDAGHQLRPVGALRRADLGQHAAEDEQEEDRLQQRLGEEADGLVPDRHPEVALAEREERPAAARRGGARRGQVAHRRSRPVRCTKTSSSVPSIRRSSTSRRRRPRRPRRRGRGRRRVAVEAHGPAARPPPALDALHRRPSARERARRVVGSPLEHVSSRPLLGGQQAPQPARRVERDHLAVVDDRDPVAEPVGLGHVVGREDERRAARRAARPSCPRGTAATAGRGRSSARRGSARAARASARGRSSAAAPCRPSSRSTRSSSRPPSPSRSSSSIARAPALAAAERRSRRRGR